MEPTAIEELKSLLKWIDDEIYPGDDDGCVKIKEEVERRIADMTSPENRFIRGDEKYPQEEQA
jgi:hypothetical protein